MQEGTVLSVTLVFKKTGGRLRQGDVRLCEKSSTEKGFKQPKIE